MQCRTWPLWVVWAEPVPHQRSGDSSGEILSRNNFPHRTHVQKHEPHTHKMTASNTRRHRNKKEKLENSNEPTELISIMAINTTSLRKHWRSLALKRRTAHTGLAQRPEW